MKERTEHLDEPYPGGESWRQAVERVAGFLQELRRGRDCERVLVVGHVATLYGLEIVANRRELEDLIGAPFEWRPGWEFVL
jgi:broad specificity phosphatase PhoE